MKRLTNFRKLLSGSLILGTMLLMTSCGTMYTGMSVGLTSDYDIGFDNYWYPTVPGAPIVTPGYLPPTPPPPPTNVTVVVPNRPTGNVRPSTPPHGNNKPGVTPPSRPGNNKPGVTPPPTAGNKPPTTGKPSTGGNIRPSSPTPPSGGSNTSGSSTGMRPGRH